MTDSTRFSPGFRELFREYASWFQLSGLALMAAINRPTHCDAYIHPGCADEGVVILLRTVLRLLRRA